MPFKNDTVGEETGDSRNWFKLTGSKMVEELDL